MVGVSRVLENEGLDKFARSVNSVLKVIRRKRAALARSDTMAELHMTAK
jgi:hypothetical protein